MTVAGLASDDPRPRSLRELAVVLQGFDQPGGVANSCLEQIVLLARTYRITLFTEAGCPELRPVPAGVLVRRLAVPGLGWMHRLAHVPRQWVFLLAVRRALLRAAAGQQFAAVIFHSHPAAALLAPALGRRGTGSILVVHGDIFERPRGTYDWCLTAWYRWATPRAYRRSSAVLCLSPEMGALVRRWTGDTVPIHWVPNSIDPASIGLEGDTAPSGWIDRPDATVRDRPELLYVGRIEPLKGIDVLLRAVARLLASGVSLQLRCIGSVSPAYRPRLQRRIAELGLERDVLLSGQQPRSLLGEAYRRCTVLVVPSRSEPQATVILEGMAAGCAILASDVGGNGMMLEAETSGLLFPRDDPAALQRGLQRLLEDPHLRQRLGVEARRRFDAAFSRQAVAPRLREALATALS